MITRNFEVVYLKELKTKNTVCQNFTKSAKGSIEDPSKKVKQKSGLNRVILATGWHRLEYFLSQDAVVIKVNPVYTWQRCSRCGYIETANRTSQSAFKCLECGLSKNADINAAINLWTCGTGDIDQYRLRPIILRGKRPQVMKRQNEYFSKKSSTYSCR